MDRAILKLLRQELREQREAVAELTSSLVSVRFKP